MYMNYSEVKDVCPLRGKGVMLKRYFGKDTVSYSGIFHNGKHIFSVKTEEEPELIEKWGRDFSLFSKCYGIEE